MENEVKVASAKDFILNEYFNVMEGSDERILNEFNSSVNFFKEVTYNKFGNAIDATAVDVKGRKTHIEIKQRTGKYSDFYEFTKSFDTIYLDTGKVDHFAQIMFSGYSLNECEIFVSIFNDGDFIVVHDLNKPQDIKWLPNQRVYNPGKKRWEYTHRLGFYWYNGTIYQRKDNGYVKWNDEQIMEHEEHIAMLREGSRTEFP